MNQMLHKNSGIPFVDKADQKSVKVETETTKKPLDQALSQRECECLQLIAGGKTSWEIGEILDISHHTVNAHIRNIVRKLGVASRPQAVAEAFRRGLIT